MTKALFLMLLAGVLTACGEDQSSNQRDSAPATTESAPATTTDRDPTPDTGTGGESQVKGNGTTTN